MTWRRSRRRDAEAALVAELEAFLAGRYAELNLAQTGRTPTWVWVNLLAHGTGSQLGRVRARRSPADHLRVWRHARSYLAAELLGLVDLGEFELRQLQRDVLVPLELQAIRQPRRWRAPRDMVRDVVHALELAQQQRRRERRNPGVPPLRDGPGERPPSP
ncbi:MAG: hypothetical protein AAGA99_13085 [Actinomycetota bacterium]